MNIEEAKLFLRNYKNYESVFSKDVLEKVFKKVDVKCFQTTETVRGTGDYFKCRGYPEVGRGQRKFKEYSGEWSREVSDFGIDYLVPCQYQLKEKDVLRDCLLYTFPYLKDFAFPTYHLNSEDDEIYIDCDNGNCLYVPIKALIKNDKDIVVERMNKYWKRYYASPDRKEKLEEQLATLETITCKKLFDILDELKLQSECELIREGVNLYDEQIR